MLSFAIGGEHRTEHENDQPDALTASRQVTGSTLDLGESVTVPPFLPTNGSRNVWSLYWEVRVPVMSPTWNWYGLHSLELGYQERFDNYSDFGSTERPKFFFRWQPIDSSLTLRGTYSEAYHAPALAESPLYFSSVLVAWSAFLSLVFGRWRKASSIAANFRRSWIRADGVLASNRRCSLSRKVL